jgi:hypothetical protein
MDENVGLYEIEIAGELDGRWSDWFGGMQVRVESQSRKMTTLSGRVDQAALRGMLNKLWDLNLVLISVKRIDKDSEPNQ